MGSKPLDGIVGQPGAVTALRRGLDGADVPQSLLFVGPEGTGKSAAAIAFAKELLGDAPLSNRRIDEGQHPDVVRIVPDGEYTKIWQLWNRPGHPAGALETLPFSPVAGKRRIYLFDKAETLNEESANSLLKALEEPPPYVQFVLCAPSPGSVLPTILSRCRLVTFGPVASEEIVAALIRDRGVAESEARLLAAYAEGSPGKAFRLADAPELRVQRDALLDLAARVAEVPAIGAFRLAEELRKLSTPPKSKKSDGDDEAEKSTRGDLGRALDILALWHGDLLRASLHGEGASLIHADRRDSVVRAARKYRPEQLAENLETLFAFRRRIARNANAQLATEVLFMKLVPR